MISDSPNLKSQNVSVGLESLISNIHTNSIGISNTPNTISNNVCLEEAQRNYDLLKNELDEILLQLEQETSNMRNHMNTSELFADPDPIHSTNTTFEPPSTTPEEPNPTPPSSPTIFPPQSGNNNIHNTSTTTTTTSDSFIKKDKTNFRDLAKNVSKKIKRNKRYTYPTEKENLFIPHGDIITEKKNKHHTRIILLNPCGITNSDTGKLEDIMTQFQAYDTDYLGLPESRINPHSDFAHNSRTLVERRIPGGLITHTNTKQQIPSSTSFQFGGVSTIMSKKMNKILKGTKMDKFGRWICQTFFVNQKLLHIYTVYRVNDTGEENENSATQTQKHQLELNGISTSSRKHVIEALREQLEKDLATNADIIVQADANESRLHSDKFFLTMMKDLGFANTMEDRLGLQIPPTQDRGREAIDHVWISRSLQEPLVSAGILPLFEFIITDHRAIVLDFCNHKLLLKSCLTLNHYTTQKISSKNITSRNDYISKIDDQLENQKVHYVFDKFKKQKHTLSRHEQICFLETCVKQLYEIMLGSENHCKHKYDGFLTPEMSILWSTKHTLQKRIRTLKWQEIHKPNLFDINELSDLEIDLEQVLNRIEELDLTAEETEDKLDTLRAQDWVDQGKFDEINTALKVLKNMRTQKKDSNAIRSVIHRNERQELSHITIPSAKEYDDKAKEHYKNTNVIWERIEIDQGEDIDDWEPVTLQSEVESMLHNWQQQHFQQANTTPLGNKKWINLIDTAKSFEDISNEAENLNPTTKELLEYLFPINDTKSTSYKINIDELCSFIDSKKEETRTSPNGIHYGHLKSIRNHIILEYMFYLIELTVDLNYIPTLWRDTITTLAPKKPGVYHIHSLRPIHIVEPMVQFISHIFWSNKFMRQCEANNSITDSQYGGRRGRQAQNAVIKQVVLWDIARFQNKLMASHMADARANFDRNMSHIVARALISKGFDPKIVKLYQTILRSQLFYIRTAFGISNKPYKYDPNNPFFGDGQGIGWSSVNQIIISTIIDEILNKLASSFKVSSADKVFNILTGVNFFIDDRIANTINHNNDITQLLKDFQKNETLQKNLLNDTGGAVVGMPIKQYVDIKSNNPVLT